MLQATNLGGSSYTNIFSGISQESNRRGQQLWGWNQQTNRRICFNNTQLKINVACRDFSNIKIGSLASAWCDLSIFEILQSRNKDNLYSTNHKQVWMEGTNPTGLQHQPPSNSPAASSHFVGSFSPSYSEFGEASWQNKFCPPDTLLASPTTHRAIYFFLRGVAVIARSAMRA